MFETILVCISHSFIWMSGIQIYLVNHTHTLNSTKIYKGLVFVIFMYITITFKDFISTWTY